jgi:hypothetical protein
MSVSSLGSSNPYSYLQWPPQSDSADPSDPTAPSDPLQSLNGAFTGGSGSAADPLLSALGSDDGSSAPLGVPPFSPDVMKALFSVQGDQSASGTPPESPLFAKFDANGDGQISQSEFENAIGPGADQSKVDALFDKLDANGDGSINQDELHSALQKAHGGHHHHHHVQDADQSQQSGDPLQSLLSGASADGATSQSATNSDGSTTTTISYADGTKVEMTTPAASADGDPNAASPPSNPNALSFSNLLKQLISLQARLAAPTTNLSV